MAEDEKEEKGLIIDRDDWIWFAAGGLAALVALYLIKNILEPQHHHWHHNYHHQHPVPIAKEVEKIYRISEDGKMY